MSDKTRVLIVEDEPLIARDLKRIVGKLGYQVVDICYHSDKALDAIAKDNYDVALLDISIEGSMTGIDLARVIKKRTDKPFIYVTSYSDSGTIELVKETMPSGYIVKPFEEGEIYSSIEIAIFTSRSKIKPSLTREYVNDKLNLTFSPKEFEIILNIMDGMSNTQIASQHFVSNNTIKSHIKNIYYKSGVSTRAALVKLILG